MNDPKFFLASVVSSLGRADDSYMFAHIANNWRLWRDLPERPIFEAVFAEDPRWAYSYAICLIGGRWPEGEPAIAMDPELAYFYAKGVIKGRWPEGEPAIATSARFSYYYARDVVKGRFELWEPAIAENAGWARHYAADVEGEPA